MFKYSLTSIVFTIFCCFILLENIFIEFLIKKISSYIYVVTVSLIFIINLINYVKDKKITNLIPILLIVSLIIVEVVLVFKVSKYIETIPFVFYNIFAFITFLFIIILNLIDIYAKKGSDSNLP